MLCFMLTVLCSCKSDKTNSTKTENNVTNTEKENTTAKENVTSAKEENKTPKEVQLTSEEKKKLDTFFSNFSEAYLEPFKSESITDDALIDFGVMHCYINNRKSFETVDAANLKVKSELVSSAVQKYFKKNINENKSTKQYKYKNGYYYVPAADGEAFTFSQIESLNELGNNLYTAFVNVYSASSGWTGNVHGTPGEWKKGEDAPELTGKYKATIQKDANSNGNNSYILIDYAKR